MTRTTLDGNELMQASFTGFNYPANAQLSASLGGNAVMQQSALGFRQAGLTWVADSTADKDTIRTLYESKAAVAYVDHDGTSTTVRVYEFSSQLRVGDFWDCTATLLEEPGTSPAPPTSDARTWTLTSPDDGGWTHANAPKAVEHDGVVYFAYVDMASGSIEVRGFDPARGRTTAATVIAAAFEVDLHAAPALWVRPDGRLLIVYSRHDGSTMFRRITTNPLPDLTLGAEVDLDASLGGGDYTYPIIVDYAGDLRLFYRDWQGGDTAVMAYSTSTDDGATWSGQTAVYRSAHRQSYWMVASDGTRIDVVASDGRNPPNAGDVTIGHVYYDGTWRRSDGTPAGSLPLGPADLTEVYDSSDGMGWPMDIVTVADSPVFTYAVVNAPSSNSWRRAHWTGSAWVRRTIDESDGVTDGPFASAVVLDHLDPDRAYAPIKVGAHWRMLRYITPDDGATWMQEILAGGATDHMTPAPVYGSTGAVRVLWMTGGPYTTYLDGGFGLSGGR